MFINCQCNAAEVPTNTNKLNLYTDTCNNLEYNELKESTLTLHVINWKNLT